ncbi:hypothetical protein FA95DRAFT_1647013 [Auriscalpium vulgare]|uniref:Uncharacterized protein n=1 Tax=Auriscalpium vulgare TaxID=40419 RepID=A0ACB8R9F4_9AGAM|nr:hypothetical protein FA95DRAFT_1647013 [Auriscalpium vulgare]
MAASLPVEILLMIVNEVTSSHDSRNLRAINKSFCAFATPRAFRTVGATNRRDSALGLASLLQSDLARYVKEAVYRDYAADEHGNAVAAVDRAPLDVDYGATTVEALLKTFTLAARLPGLISFRFVFHPKCPRDVAATVDLQHALLFTIGDAAPHLRFLTLINLTPVHHWVYGMSKFKSALFYLTDLRISTTSAANLPEGSAMWRGLSDFWFYDIGMQVLHKLANVTLLVVENDMPSGSSRIPQFVQRKTLPKLKYLVVRNLGIDIDSADVDEFVRRHPLLEWIDTGEGLRWVRHTHADPQDETEYELPPSMAD